LFEIYVKITLSKQISKKDLHNKINFHCSLRRLLGMSVQEEITKYGTACKVNSDFTKTEFLPDFCQPSIDVKSSGLKSVD